MGKGARSHYSTPPSYRFTPGIVARGETMVIARRTFVVPDETPRPQGRRTMTVGRRTYSWSTAADTSPAKGGLVTDDLPDDDDGSAMMSATLADGSTGWVLSPDKGRTWEVQRTVDMGDDPLPRLYVPPKIKTGRKSKVKASVPRQKSGSALSERDTAVRQYLDGKGLTTVEITPAIRAAALEAIESDRQLTEYVR